MSERITSGGSANSAGGSGGSAAKTTQPSVARFYDWSSNITGCVQVRQYHQTDPQHYQQQSGVGVDSAGAAVFPVRRPSKATLAKMRQYYNPGMKLLQAGRPADSAWRETSQLTKGERHLAMARGAAAPVRPNLFDDPEPVGALRALPLEGVGQCQCSYDPRLYPVYTSRSHGPMCVVCKLRRPGARQRNKHRAGDWLDDTEDSFRSAGTMAEAGATERLRAPPSTPRPGEGRTEMIPPLPDGRKAILDVFLPNAEREPALPLPRPTIGSARSQRTLSSPDPSYFP